MNARFARVLAPLVVTLLVPGSALCDSAPSAAVDSIADVSSPENARLSLDVESAPMAQIFSRIEAMTQLRARYAAPPDTILSAQFDEEPLIPALEKMLAGSNWTAKLVDNSLFLNAPQSTKWEIWTGKTAPPADWNLVPGVREYSLPAVRLSSSLDTPSQLTATLDAGAAREISPQEKAARRAKDALWRTMSLAFEARRVPGISLRVAENTMPRNADAKNTAPKELGDEEKTDGKTASTRAIWLRCDFTLRVVPSRLYLSIATPDATTLYLGGAPVLKQRSGQNRVEISQFVKRGVNRVALHWKSASPFSSSQPLLRYEWQTDLAP